MVMVLLIGFAVSLILCVLIETLGRAHPRVRAGDPFAAPFGDVPASTHISCPPPDTTDRRNW